MWHLGIYICDNIFVLNFILSLSLFFVRDGGNSNECFRCQEDVKIDLKSGRLTLAYAELSQLPFHIVDPHCHWVTFLDLSHNNIE